MSDILIFIVFLALAVKGLIEFYDWGTEKFKKIFNKEYSKLNGKKELERRLKHVSDIMANLTQNQNEIDKALLCLQAKIDMLIESDKDAIKSYITENHHYYCYQKHWIDDFNLDCLERRFRHYEDEGGNSFINGFMEELRALPKQPPEE